MALPRIYTVDQVADYLGCHSSTVHRAIRDGRLRATVIGSGTAQPGLRITETAVVEFLGEPSEADPTPPHGIERPLWGVS